MTEQEKKERRGGPRPGSGRKRLGILIIKIRLTNEQHELLKKAGGSVWLRGRIDALFSNCSSEEGTTPVMKYGHNTHYVSVCLSESQRDLLKKAGGSGFVQNLIDKELTKPKRKLNKRK